MDAAENERNLVAIRAAMASRTPSVELKQPPSPVARAVAATPSDSAKRQLIEIALRMVSMAKALPTPGVTDTYVHSRTLAQDAKILLQISEGM